MATIKQTESQIANVHKRIANHESKIQMYQTRLEKALEKINAAIPGSDITIDNYQEKERAEYSTGDYSHYKLWSSVGNAAEGIRDHEKAIRFERRDLDRLENVLECLKKDAEKAAAEYNTKLETALRGSMQEFRKVWIERMMSWFDRHYDFIIGRVDDARKETKRINRILDEYYFDLRRKHAIIRLRLENKKKINGEIISDDANRYKGNKDAYLNTKRDMLEKQFDNDIVKLTYKCQMFNVDDASVQVHNPAVTEKGFQVMITDNSSRLIFARIIWAAEYSDIVSPHTRYIVTSKDRTLNK